MKSRIRCKKSLVTLLAAALVASLLGVGAAAAPDANGASSAGQTGFDVTGTGISGTDSGDDTAALQGVLDRYDSVYIPDGVYYINADVSLRLRSNQALTLSDGAVLKALPSAREFYAVLNISNASNVTVKGGRIVGDRDSHLGTSGEWGMGIFVTDGSRDVTLSNITVSNCWGDGVYLGDGASIVRNITLSGVTCDNNRRQGLSVTGERRR